MTIPKIFNFCPFNADTQEDGVELNIYNHAAVLIAVLEKLETTAKDCYVFLMLNTFLLVYKSDHI